MAVEPQVFDLLVHLIRHRDRVVSKDDLLATVWHGRIVSESALFNRINAARSAIGDTGEQQRLIKTLPRKGIRFVGEVREDETAAAPSRSPTSAPELPLPLPDRPSIAVLPFANMSGDPEQEYFADGISEDLITGLARIRWLFVIARNSTFVYKRRAVDVKTGLARAWRPLRARRQRAPRRQAAAHLARSSSTRRPAAITGPNATTASSATSSPCRTKSPAASPAAIEPHLLAAEGVRALSRSADDLGAWELVARAQTHFWRLTRADYETAVDAARTGRRGLSGLRAGTRPAGFLPGVCRAHGVDRPRSGLAPRPPARHRGRSRSTIAIPGDTSRWAIGP